MATINIVTIILLILSFLEIINCNPVNVTYRKIKEKFTMTSHLKHEKIQKICKTENRKLFCISNDTKVCAMRVVEQGETQYKDFENTCYLFLCNMCDNPGNEYYIASTDSCFNYNLTRRQAASAVNKVTKTTMLSLGKSTTFKLLYPEETSYDGHICPMSCPEVYSPVCVSANRGEGKDFRMFTFINHCLSDIYYCKHSEKFAPPEGALYEDVAVSPLSWSFCAASRYTQFARFTEVASSMGHYGWLAGDYKATHIMEPHERKPGFG